MTHCPALVGTYQTGRVRNWHCLAADMVPVHPTWNEGQNQGVVGHTCADSCWTSWPAAASSLARRSTCQTTSETSLLPSCSCRKTFSYPDIHG